MVQVLNAISQPLLLLSPDQEISNMNVSETQICVNTHKKHHLHQSGCLSAAASLSHGKVQLFFRGSEVAENMRGLTLLFQRRQKHLGRTVALQSIIVLAASC